MKKILLLTALFSLVAASAQAQVFTGDGYGPPPPPVGTRYRLRDPYPVNPYPAYPVGPNTSPDTAEVGRPYYYGYPYAYPYSYPGVSSDGNSVYVPGR